MLFSSQYETKQRKQWRSLEFIQYPVITDNENSQLKFALDMAFALNEAFAKAGYKRFSGIVKKSTAQRNGLEIPYYEFVCHQAEFCGAIRRNYARFLSSILALKAQFPDAIGKEKMRQMVTAERQQFEEEWDITVNYALSSPLC